VSALVGLPGNNLYLDYRKHPITDGPGGSQTRKAPPAEEARSCGLRDAWLCALGRWAASAWLLLQGTAAATAAWTIAELLGSHGQPFFAPLAAVIALNAPLGERGLNAMRLLLGVIVGIVVGELAVATLGGGYGTLALAVFTATSVARALGGARIVIAQVAAGAILTVASANGEVGVNRLIDAVIGGGVALVFSQFLFSPEPVALLRRAEAAALADMVDGLKLTARALERDDDELAERAVTNLRDLRDRLSEVARLRRASTRVARHSLVWQSQLTPVVRETENAAHLDLLGGSCLMLARTAMATSPSERRTLVPSVRELADVLADLAGQLGDRPARQHAADRALDIARRLAGSGAPSTSISMLTAIAILLMVATDVMVFAGVDPAQARAAVREGTRGLRVPAPPPTPHMPFKLKRWRRRR
jgi:hypothetical protein